MTSDTRLTDGSWEFSGGVDSGKVTTLQSELVENGLKRNQSAWLKNATCRGGGISPRAGWKKLCRVATEGLYQGGYLYDASALSNDNTCYLMLQINGRVYQVRVDTDDSVVDLSAVSGLTNPDSIAQAYMCQGERFLVIQAGDYKTLPLFWDGATLRRSLGIISTTNTPAGGVLPYNELPAAGPMDYYMGRLWYAQGRIYSAGDIVGGAAGTAAYELTDAILKVTENPLAFGGDGFAVPSNSGNITALAHTANLDVSLGDGPLFPFTRKAVYKMVVPVTRDDWTDADTDNQPLQSVAQQTNGASGDRGIVSHNGDLFYQSADGIRSLILALRYYGQWGNTPISSNVDRAMSFNDQTLMNFASGVAFNNRLYQTCLPFDTNSGVAFRGIAVLDFDLISSLDTKLPPVWEGMYEGLKVLQLFSGDFDGKQRCFAVVISDEDDGLDVWELTQSDRSDQGDKAYPEGDRRILWYAETPSWTWGKDLELKQLDGAEIFLDKIYGTVDVQVDYRVDADPCWQFWYRQQLCSARTSCEDVDNPVCYPEQPYHDNYLFPLTLPVPPLPACQSINRRPMNQGYQFQLRVAVKGHCRIRGILVYALDLGKSPFAKLRG